MSHRISFEQVAELDTSTSDGEYTSAIRVVSVPRSDRVLRSNRTPARRLQVTITSARSYNEVQESMDQYLAADIAAHEEEEEARRLRAIEDEEGIPAHIRDPNPEGPTRKKAKVNMPGGHGLCINGEVCGHMILDVEDKGRLLCVECLKERFEYPDMPAFE